MPVGISCHLIQHLAGKGKECLIIKLETYHYLKQNMETGNTYTFQFNPGAGGFNSLWNVKRSMVFIRVLCTTTVASAWQTNEQKGQQYQPRSLHSLPDTAFTKLHIQIHRKAVDLGLHLD